MNPTPAATLRGTFGQYPRSVPASNIMWEDAVLTLMTAPSDIVTLVVRAHEVIYRVSTNMGEFLRTYGVADGSIEVAAALGVVFVTWVLAAIVIGGFVRTMWIVTKRIIDRGGEATDGPKPEQMQ